MDKTLSLLALVATLTACSAESGTAPTSDASTATDCPRTGAGTVALDGGACVYTCPRDFTPCPGVGCVDLTVGSPEHCGACGATGTAPHYCDRMPGSTTWFCRTTR
jgi:hypothetical protein